MGIRPDSHEALLQIARQGLPRPEGRPKRVVIVGAGMAGLDPGQQTRLYEAIVAPEGRIHFAGEHASLAHAWIQGAIESGLRTAQEIGVRP